MKRRFIRSLLAATIAGCMMLSTGCGKSDESIKETVNEQETVTKAQEEEKPVNCAWAETTTFYEIFVRSFADGNGDGIGDFAGIADNILHLKDLGVGAVWLMPMMDSTTYHGYDVVDYYSTNPDYGTMEDFERMVKVCHENGIKVIIDFVVNHTSSKNPWFKEALNDENSKYRNYYFIEKERPVDKEDSTYSEWRKDSETGLFYYGHYDFIMPDLNYNNSEVRKEIINVAKFWLEHGVDGFRLDGAKEIDADINVTIDWWSEFTKAVTEVKPDVFIVGENWTSDKEEVSKYYSAMPSSFNFIAADAILSMAKGRPYDIVNEMNNMREMFLKNTNSANSATDIMIDSVMIGNHDMDRVITRLQDNETRTKLAATIQFTLPGTPFIYYGEEIGQAGQKPDDNRREPFDWYAGGEGEGMTTMTKFFNPNIKYVVPNDGCSVEEENPDPSSILNHYRKIIKIRNNNKAFYNGKYETIGTYGSLYGYKVSDSDNKYLVVHNLGDEKEKFSLKVDGMDLYNECEVKQGEIELGSGKSLILKYNSGDEPLNTEEFTEIVEKEYTVTFRLTVPENTPDEPIYIIGSFDGWKVADEPYIMTKVDDTTYEYVMTGTAMSSIEYKYNRGTWNKREQNEEHKDLVGPLQKENREYTFEKNGAVVEDVIGSWSDIKN